MLGRINLFRGALDVAARELDASIRLAERDHGWRSCPAPRRCAVRSSWPALTRPERLNFFSKPSPEPASSAIPAGKGSPPEAWPW
jgi:hypothetical protein